MKAYITKEQALSILPEEEYIHTYYNASFGLMGADWSIEEIVDKLNNSDILELAGPMARNMGHGLCAYSKAAKYQSEILFIQTDEEKLKKLEGELSED